jgi:hypothetical protein
MESAIFGLLGVLLGAVLTVAKEWWFQRRKEQKEADYLAIQVVCQLERYVGGCAAVVADDGFTEGRPDDHGYGTIQVATPKFEPELLKVEWRSLPTTLLYDVLDLPRQAESASQYVDHAFEYATLPDRDEGFEERQFRYATLGIAASGLATRLRQHARLPGQGIEDWNPVAYMEERLAEIGAMRRARRASVSVL